jgi:hypothetical protein
MGNHHRATMQTEGIHANSKHTTKEGRQAFIRQKSDDYKSSLNRYPKSTKRSLPGGCSPSTAWRERRMDFAPEKPALEVDEVRPS